MASVRKKPNRHPASSVRRSGARPARTDLVCRRRRTSAAPPRRRPMPRAWSRRSSGAASAIPTSTPPGNSSGAGSRGLCDRASSPTTLAGYGRHVAMASREIGEIPLSRLTAQDLDRAYGKLIKSGGLSRDGKGTPRPLSRRTVLQLHRCLHTAFEQARKWKLVAENPARDASPPTPEKGQVKAFTTDEVARLLEAARADGAETYLIVACLLTGGLRRSEVLGLAFDCIDFEGGSMTIRRALVQANQEAVLRERGKTESALRTIAIPPVLVDMLREQRLRVLEQALAWGRDYRREPLLVFPGEAGTPRLPQTLTGLCGPDAPRSDHRALAVHAWRHTAATSLLHSGANIKTVQARLGHANPAITMALYVHPVVEADEAAAAHFGSVLAK